MREPTQDLVRELFEYRDGNLYWKESGSGRAPTGVIAGAISKQGYRLIGVDGKMYFAHRLIFLYHRGYLPICLDHIDRDPSNNNIDNIREATHQENAFNMKKQKSYGGKPTSSNYRGVSWYKQYKKWESRICINGKTKYLGIFTSEIDAAKAYDDAANELFGEFANTNFDKAIS